jgi:chromosome partitioning protein
VVSDYILVPACPDYLSTLGIDYLIRSVDGLIKDYNDFAEVAAGEAVSTIDPEIIGVVFTMIQEYADSPIAAQRGFIQQAITGGLPVFTSYIKRNHTLFADAPQYGVPVVLTNHTNPTYKSVVGSLEAVATEFAKKLGL